MIGYEYVDDVLNGNLVVCEAIRQACQRSQDDLIRSLEDPAYPYTYHEPSAEHVMLFAGLCKHSKGPLARQPMILEPWQQWVLGQLFGWRKRDDLEIRRFREALVHVARKNGKSTFSSVLALYELLLGEYGSEVYSVATKADQARISWASAAEIGNLLDPTLKDKLNTTVTTIGCKDNNSYFRFVGRDSKTLDGLNPNLVIVDEAAAIRNRDVVEVMTSAIGARSSPLVLYISTASFTRDTAYFEKLSYVRQIFDGTVQDETVFGAIYELDREDSWSDPLVWGKANPNLGVSLQLDYLESQVKQAQTVVSQQNSVLVKHFNVFTSTADSWMDIKHWDACKGDVDRTGRCFIGTDLAATQDLCAVTRVWDNGDGKYSVDTMTWLPENAFAGAPPHVRTAYDTARSAKLLHVNPGYTTDYSNIRDYLIKTCEEYDVGGIACDPYNATELVNELEDKGLPISIMRQGMSNMSPAAKQTESWILNNQFRHDGNHLMTWCLSNCSVYTDVNDNIKVRKGDDEALKIDPIIALIMASSLAAGNAETPKSMNVSFFHI